MLPKKIAAIHDLSGLGHSSLAVALPILSVMGIQVAPMPTAVLSSQTDGYQDYSFVDLTDSLPQFIKHWQSLQLKFDGIYSGFLGSDGQIDLVSDFIRTFKQPQTLVLVDPVLGDNGALYDTMNQRMVQKMRALIAQADLITPNLTELYLLLGEPYRSRSSEEDLRKAISALAAQGPKTVLVTSVWAADDKHSRIVAYERQKDCFTEVLCRHIAAAYPGTGDIFASVLVGGLLRGLDLKEAIVQSADFVARAIEVSLAGEVPYREGVLLEQVLGELVR